MRVRVIVRVRVRRGRVRRVRLRRVRRVEKGEVEKGESRPGSSTAVAWLRIEARVLDRGGSESRVRVRLRVGRVITRVRVSRVRVIRRVRVRPGSSTGVARNRGPDPRQGWLGIEAQILDKGGSEWRPGLGMYVCVYECTKSSGDFLFDPSDPCDCSIWLFGGSNEWQSKAIERSTSPT